MTKNRFARLDADFRKANTPADHSAYGATRAKPFPKNSKPRMWVVMSDLHTPEHDRPSVAAVFDFIARNRKSIHGLILLGDALDNESISHHTAHLPGLRKHGGFQADIDLFSREILDRVDDLLPKAEKVFVEGNHCRFLTDFLESAPEFKGALSWPKLLRLPERGWSFIPQGGTFNIGPLICLHGDQVGSGQNIAKKIVDSYCASTLSGHVHTFAAATKCSEIKKKDRWVSTVLPCLTTLTPRYARSRPNAHIRGFGIVESYDGGRLFNVYVPIINEGQFCFAGKVYGR
jgi:predicted phosphodiesterase